MNIPIRIHPQNPKLFEFRGKPLVLVTATEHYGAVMNRPFDFERYLADAAEKKQTLTRLFTLFRELQGPTNPYSTCKPESPDYVAPFRRIGPKRALDGEPQYDLQRWNPEFFDRLHRFLSLASDCGIVVEVVLLSNTYNENVWALNPLNPKNNVNGLKDIHWPEYMSQWHADLFGWQCAHVRKIVEETNRYDNVFYEICNEPGGGTLNEWVSALAKNPQPRLRMPTPDEVNEWERAIASVIRETESKLPNQHLIAGQEAFTWHPFTQTSDKSFRDLPLDIVNMHPLPSTTFGGTTYDMGNFMAKELKLRAVRDFCLATYSSSKPLNYDEDNSSTQYKDVDAWTIHRKRAWTTLFSGGHYDMIDFSITIYTPTGTPESQRCIRPWMKHLSQFVHSIDLVRARPRKSFLKQQPPHTMEAVFAVDGEDYCIYLADDRELGEQGSGEAIHGHIVLDLPDNEFSVASYSPENGQYSLPAILMGKRNCQIAMPEFRHDLVLRIRLSSFPNGTRK